jgi:hypothetical protein
MSELKKIAKNPKAATEDLNWNLSERQVFALLASKSNGALLNANDMAAALWPKRSKEKMSRRARNSLRRLVREGYVAAKERGEYKLTPKARRALR